jgi:hypothetical protein
VGRRLTVPCLQTTCLVIGRQIGIATGSARAHFSLHGLEVLSLAGGSTRSTIVGGRHLIAASETQVRHHLGSEGIHVAAL